jgi:hypothetical protein
MILLISLKILMDRKERIKNARKKKKKLVSSISYAGMPSLFLFFARIIKGRKEENKVGFDSVWRGKYEENGS